MIPDEELEIEVIYSNSYVSMTTDAKSLVRHIPTPLVAVAGTDRSQMQNKRLALLGLEAMLANTKDRR